MELPKSELKELAKQYKINLLILFGSYQTERFNTDSDIDLAVQAEDPNLIKQEKLTILNELTAILNYSDIDLILLNQADPLLKFNIACEGRLIYEQEKGLFNIFKVRAMSEHNDAQKFYKLDKKFIDNYLKTGGEKDGQQRVSPPQVD